MKEIENLFKLVQKARKRSLIFFVAGYVILFAGTFCVFSYHWSVASLLLIMIISIITLGISAVFINLATAILAYAARKNELKKSLEYTGNRLNELERLQNLRDDQIESNKVDAVWEGMIVKARVDAADARKTIEVELKDAESLKEKLDQTVIKEPWASKFCKKLFRYKEG